MSDAKLIAVLSPSDPDLLAKIEAAMTAQETFVINYTDEPPPPLDDVSFWHELQQVFSPEPFSVFRLTANP